MKRLFLCWIIVVYASLCYAEEEAIQPSGFVASQGQKLTVLQAQYQEIVRNGGWPHWKQGKKIEPHQSDNRIALLRVILSQTGDYSGNITSDSVYDDILVSAMQKFQMHHGLNPDGIIGRRAQAVLAISAEQRLEQVMHTLRNLQGVKEEFEDKFILVNLPAYQLYAVDSGKPTLNMRVIIGNKEHPTPVFDSVVTDVLFNPSWHVPKSIVENELIPKLAQDPDYFERSNFVITDDDGNQLDAQTVSVDQPLHFRQRSGDKNALGKIKFNLKNSDAIYLHFTASPKLFEKEYRALSHGCVRVENPRALAYFVMEDNKDWTMDKINQSYDSKREHSVKVAELPVHVVYWKVFVDENNEAYFYDDVYADQEEPQ